MKKILLADDSITIQKVVELTFSEDEYQVSCVSNGALPSKPNPKFDDSGKRVIVGCELHWDKSMTN